MLLKIFFIIFAILFSFTIILMFLPIKLRMKTFHGKRNLLLFSFISDKIIKIFYTPDNFYLRFVILNIFVLRYGTNNETAKPIYSSNDDFSTNKTGKRTTYDSANDKREDNFSAKGPYLNSTPVNDDSNERYEYVDINSKNNNTLRTEPVSKQKIPAQDHSEQERFSEENTEEGEINGKWHTVKRYWYFILKEKSIARKVFNWFKKVLLSFLHTVKFENFSFDIKFSAGNFSDTGKIYGYLTALNTMLSSGGMNNFRFTVAPIFIEKPYFYINGSLTLSTSLYKLLKPFAVAIVSFPYIASVKLWMNYKKFRKSR